MSNKSFTIADFRTQKGVTLDIRLSYRTRGQLNAARDNAILVLTSYAAQDDEAQILLCGGECELDEYFVVFINMLGNGASSSPSNTAAPFDGPRFPLFTINDNVAAQNALIDSLDVQRVRLVCGFSMGALQAYEWACHRPDFVDAFLPVCGAARISRHNWLFLDSAREALQLDPAFNEGDYRTQPADGLSAFSRVYAAWLFSQDFFREEAYRSLGLEDIESVVAFTRAYFERRDANDLLAMLRTWQHADISANSVFNGDFEAALSSIKARSIVMPCTTDLYFTPADSANEVQQMSDAELRPLDSIYGHFAGAGQLPETRAQIDKAILDLLR